MKNFTNVNLISKNFKNQIYNSKKKCQQKNNYQMKMKKKFKD